MSSVEPDSQATSEYAEAYHRVRFPFDERRDTVWREVVGFIQSRYVRPGGVVVDLGAGYCDFINNVDASERHAVDLFEAAADYAAEGVHVHIQSCASLPFENSSVDTAFASNLFEHLVHHDLLATLA